MSHQGPKPVTNFFKFRQKIANEMAKTNTTYVGLLKSFKALDSNCQRVDFVLGVINPLNINVDFQTDGKNDAAAVNLKERGNAMYKEKNLEQALEYYTQSICHAEENSVNLGIAYANRSAVLLELNLRKECLQDIQRALANNYPEHSHQKLKERQKKANNITDNNASEEPHEPVPTVINKNSKIQCASDSIQIEENENYGRHVVAVKDIKAGEILAVEKPFASYLLANQYLTHCHECVELCYNLIPCKGCTNAMYCSEACRNQAFETYHKYECPILATLRFLGCEVAYLPLKIAFLARDQCGKNLVNLAEEMYCSDSYKEIHNLTSNTSKRAASDLFERAVAAAAVFKLVKGHTDFFKDADVKLEGFFKEVLLLHMQTSLSNCHAIIELVPDSRGLYESRKFAGAAYAFLSLFNHSCCPNVTKSFHGSTLVLRAFRNIQQGEQCFDNYGWHFGFVDREERLKELQNRYFFVCTCQACENNWPAPHALRPVSTETAGSIVMRRLAIADVKTAKSQIQNFLTKLVELQKLPHSLDFFDAQEVVRQCFLILGNKRKIF